MSSEAQGPRVEAAPTRKRVLRWSVAIVVAMGSLAAAIAAPVLGRDRAVSTIRRHTPSPKPARADGRSERIVFASRSDTDGRYHLHVVNPDGTGEAPLTFGPDEDRTPAWSPNRQLIAFARVPKTSGSAGEVAHLYIMKADGTGLSQLTEGPDGAKDPSWSPDGIRIVFADTNASTGGTRLLVASIDGTPPPQLPEPPAGCVDREPAWAPDGRAIAFSRKCGEEPSRLVLIRMDGTGSLELASFGRTPSWSPDGSKIAYTGYGTYGPAVFVINADGTGRVKLTADFTGDPVWSPDGRRIVFTVSEVAILKLYVINVDGTGSHRLTGGVSNEVAPSW